MQLDRLESLHGAGVVHCDLKADNIVLKSDEENRSLMLVDLGCARRFMDDNNVHIPHNKNEPFTGTWVFGSTMAHHGSQYFSLISHFMTIDISFYQAKAARLTWRRYAFF